MASIYEELNIRTFINAAGTYTVVGGSRMSQETLTCMQEAAMCHVSLPELQNAIENKIAEMTKNESSVVCNGAAAGLYLSAISAIGIRLNKPTKQLSFEEISQFEVLSMNAHHIPYDFALQQVGIRQKWIGTSCIEGSMNTDDIKWAINNSTVAIYYYATTPFGFEAPGALGLEEIIDIAQAHNIPVIVDAAAQLPPVENLWNLTMKGVDVAIFSGGKDLRGPQSSGLIVGKKYFLEKIKETNFPNYGYGRMLKVGREEMVGLYSALKQYLALDHSARNDYAEQSVQNIIDAFYDSSLYHIERAFPNEAAQPMAYARVHIKKDIPLDKIINEILAGEPAVFVKKEKNVFYINPMTLYENEVDEVIKKLKIVETKFLK